MVSKVPVSKVPVQTYKLRKPINPGDTARWS